MVRLLSEKEQNAIFHDLLTYAKPFLDVSSETGYVVHPDGLVIILAWLSGMKKRISEEQFRAIAAVLQPCLIGTIATVEQFQEELQSGLSLVQILQNIDIRSLVHGLQAVPAGTFPRSNKKKKKIS